MVHWRSIGPEEGVAEAACHTVEGMVVTAVGHALVADYHKNLVVVVVVVVVVAAAVAEEEGTEVVVEGILRLLHLLHRKNH